MIFRLYPLPLDLTGEMTHNRVVREYHDLAPQNGLDFKVIVLDKGVFYKDSLTITDMYENVLTPNDDYQLTMFNSEVFERSGLEACSVIVVTNPKYIGRVYVTAQMVGDSYCVLEKEIANQSLGILNNTRPLHYRNIRELPDTFRLSGHMHPYWDLYGFTEVTENVEKIVAKFRLKVDEDLTLLYEDFESLLTSGSGELGALDTIYNAHMANKNNPHRETSASVHLENVVDLPIATAAQYNSNSKTNQQYATPYSTKKSLEHNFYKAVDQHTTNYNNPHKTTAAHLGTLDRNGINSLGALYYDKGSTVTYARKFGLDGGVTFQHLFDTIRTDLDANELKTGYLNVTNLPLAEPYEPSLLAPAAGGGFRWWSIEDIGKKLMPLEAPSHSLAWTGTVLFNKGGTYIPPPPEPVEGEEPPPPPKPVVETALSTAPIIERARLYNNTALNYDEGSICLVPIEDNRTFIWRDKLRHQNTLSTVVVTSKNRSWQM